MVTISIVFNEQIFPIEIKNISDIKILVEGIEHENPYANANPHKVNLSLQFTHEGVLTDVISNAYGSSDDGDQTVGTKSASYTDVVREVEQFEQRLERGYS